MPSTSTERSLATLQGAARRPAVLPSKSVQPERKRRATRRIGRHVRRISLEMPSTRLPITNVPAGYRRETVIEVVKMIAETKLTQAVQAAHTGRYQFLLIESTDFS